MPPRVRSIPPEKAPPFPKASQAFEFEMCVVGPHPWMKDGEYQGHRSHRNAVQRNEKSFLQCQWAIEATAQFCNAPKTANQQAESCGRYPCEGKIISINYFAPYSLCRANLPAMYHDVPRETTSLNRVAPARARDMQNKTVTSACVANPATIKSTPIGLLLYIAASEPPTPMKHRHKKSPEMNKIAKLLGPNRRE